MNRGKYFSSRDMKLINSVVNELYDDVVEAIVLVFKISTHTKTNIYGEVSPDSNKVYFSPIEISCGIDISEMTSDDGEFGVNRVQPHTFKFFEQELKRNNFYPEHGDIILYNEKYFEITNVARDQLIGGQPDKSHSIICQTIYSSISNLQIVPRP